jgi:hypothetical protein
MAEAPVLKGVLEYLTARGIYAWRSNNVGVYNRKRDAYVFHGLRGVSDVLGILPDGRLLAIECKSPGKRPSEAQDAFLEAIAARGGVATWVTSVDELEADLREAGF